MRQVDGSHVNAGGQRLDEATRRGIGAKRAAFRIRPIDRDGIEPDDERRIAAHHAPRIAHRPGVVWVQVANQIKPVRVRVGITDGTNTEVIADELKANDVIVVGESKGGAQAAEDARNPFLPQFGRGSGGSRGGGGRGGR